MSKVLERLARAAGLSDIHDKVMEGKRLSFDDGVRLFESRELMAVGAMANVVRERKNGNDAYFVRNMHLNPTNVCTVDCKFCGFYRPYRAKASGWTWSASTRWSSSTRTTTRSCCGSCRTKTRSSLSKTSPPRP